MLIALVVSIVLIGAYIYLGWNRRQNNHPSEPDPDLVCDRHLRMVSKRQQVKRFRAKNNITVADLMTENVTIVEHDTSVRDLRELLKVQRTRHLLVQEHGLLVGVVSDRDLMEHRGRIAADVMTRDPVTVSPARSIQDALSLMLGKRISSVAVVSAGKPCGIITTTDFLLALESFLNEAQDTLSPAEPAAFAAKALNEQASTAS